MSSHTPARGQSCPGQTDSYNSLRKTGPRPMSYTGHLRARGKQLPNLSTVTTINPSTCAAPTTWNCHHWRSQETENQLIDRRLHRPNAWSTAITEVRPLLLLLLFLLTTIWKPLSVELVVEVSRAHFHGNTEIVCAILTHALTNVQRNFPGATSHVKWQQMWYRGNYKKPQPPISRHCKDQHKCRRVPLLVSIYCFIKYIFFMKMYVIYITVECVVWNKYFLNSCTRF